MKRTLPLGLFFFFFLISFGEITTAQPPLLPFTVKGNVFLDGEPVPPGTMITAEIGDEIVGRYNVTKQGLYTMGIESRGKEGMLIKLYVNGIDANANVTLKSGEVETIDMSVRTPSGNDMWYYAVTVLIIVIVMVLAIVKHGRK